ncbi:MAG: hypothetical protein FJW96_13470 [Actinobacteria bacterium]|nr:hypothetical protein [Actinomycetota bacterium]
MRPRALAVSGRGLVDPAEPVLAADDEGFTRGRAAFETLRVYGGRPFRLAQHLERLRRSASILGVEPPPAGEIEELVELALDAAELPDAALRLYWTPGPPGGKPFGLVFVSPVPDTFEPLRAHGLRLASLEVPRRQQPWLLPGSKSVSYAVNMAVEAEAKRRGADDAVFVDEAGIVLEGPTTNIWWRRDDVLLTPSLTLGILAGETRASMLELAGPCRFRVEEGEYPLQALLDAEEIFTTSSLREVMPVVQVDGRPFPRGHAAASLQAALRREAGAG